MKLETAVKYLEDLGEARCGSISLDFRRTDDCRRKAMLANKSPLISYNARVIVRRLPTDPADGIGGTLFVSFQRNDEDPGRAIEEAIFDLTTWLNQSAEDDGSDLV